MLKNGDILLSVQSKLPHIFPDIQNYQKLFYKISPFFLVYEYILDRKLSKIITVIFFNHIKMRSSTNK